MSWKDLIWGRREKDNQLYRKSLSKGEQKIIISEKPRFTEEEIKIINNVLEEIKTYNMDRMDDGFYGEKELQRKQSAYENMIDSLKKKVVSGEKLTINQEEALMQASDRLLKMNSKIDILVNPDHYIIRGRK